MAAKHKHCVTLTLIAAGERVAPDSMCNVITTGAIRPMALFCHCTKQSNAMNHSLLISDYKLSDHFSMTSSDATECKKFAKPLSPQ